MLQSHESNLPPGWLGPSPRKYRRCPHCSHVLSIAEAVKVLYGDGHRKFVGVRINGLAETVVIDASYYNPATMQLIE
jgi:hypothetical protein